MLSADAPAEVTAPVRVVVVDDDDDLLMIVSLLLELDPRFEVVGKATTVEAAQVAVGAVRPDVVLTDLVVGSERLDVLRELRDADDSLVVVVLSAHDRVLKEPAVLAAGAHAYLEKRQIDQLADQLAEAYGRAIA